jgi:hypothetical protein
VLATIGSTAPFVGLFGTVWGIMHAFDRDREQQNTNLAVVAPGIAEALVATALGLLAAIPAVIFYNKLSADATGSLRATRLRRRVRHHPVAPAGRCVMGAGSGRSGGGGDAAGGGAAAAAAADVRDQRHALRRRDAGAADHLHGGGAAADRRRAGANCPKPPPIRCRARTEEPLTVTLTADGGGRLP